MIKIREYTKLDATLVGNLFNFTQLVENEGTFEKRVQFCINIKQVNNKNKWDQICINTPKSKKSLNDNFYDKCKPHGLLAPEPSVTSAVTFNPGNIERMKSDTVGIYNNKYKHTYHDTKSNLMTDISRSTSSPGTVTGFIGSNENDNNNNRNSNNNSNNNSKRSSMNSNDSINIVIDGGNNDNNNRYSISQAINKGTEYIYDDYEMSVYDAVSFGAIGTGTWNGHGRNGKNQHKQSPVIGVNTGIRNIASDRRAIFTTQMKNLMSTHGISVLKDDDSNNVNSNEINRNLKMNTNIASSHHAFSLVNDRHVHSTWSPLSNTDANSNTNTNTNRTTPSVGNMLRAPLSRNVSVSHLSTRTNNTFATISNTKSMVPVLWSGNNTYSVSHFVSENITKNDESPESSVDPPTTNNYVRGVPNNVDINTMNQPVSISYVINNANSNDINPNVHTQGLLSQAVELCQVPSYAENDSPFVLGSGLGKGIIGGIDNNNNNNSRRNKHRMTHRNDTPYQQSTSRNTKSSAKTNTRRRTRIKTNKTSINGTFATIPAVTQYPTGGDTKSTENNTATDCVSENNTRNESSNVMMNDHNNTNNKPRIRISLETQCSPPPSMSPVSNTYDKINKNLIDITLKMTERARKKQNRDCGSQRETQREIMTDFDANHDHVNTNNTRDQLSFIEEEASHAHEESLNNGNRRKNSVMTTDSGKAKTVDINSRVTKIHRKPQRRWTYNYSYYAPKT